MRLQRLVKFVQTKGSGFDITYCPFGSLLRECFIPRVGLDVEIDQFQSEIVQSILWLDNLFINFLAHMYLIHNCIYTIV